MIDQEILQQYLYNKSERFSSRARNIKVPMAIDVHYIEEDLKKYRDRCILRAFSIACKNIADDIKNEKFDMQN